MQCPLCASPDCRPVGEDKRRRFFRCNECTLIFIPHAFHLSRAAEKRRYELHDNTIGNSGYVRFLGEVSETVASYCTPDERILDYGCGKDAVLTELLRQRGLKCDPFDPLYDFPPLTFDRQYDVVILCEVIEHCRNVRVTLSEIDRLLAPGGILFVRTKCYPPVNRLTTWWYTQDLTHVCFFSRTALEHAAGEIGRKLEDTDVSDLYLMRSEH